MRDDTMNIGTIRKLMGGRGSAKKYSCKGKLDEKNSCTPSNAKIFVQLPKKKLYKLGKIFWKKIHAPFKIAHPPHNLSNGPSLSSVTFLNNKNSDQK